MERGGQQTEPREVPREKGSGLDRRSYWQIIRAVCAILAIGGIIWGTIGIAADQWIRNLVDRKMEGDDIFRRIALSEREFSEVGINWRRAIAEIDLRKDRDSERLREIVRGLRPRDIETIDEVSGKWLRAKETGLIWQGSKKKGDEGEIGIKSISRLQALGVIENPGIGEGTEMIRKVTSGTKSLAIEGRTLAVVTEAENRVPIEKGREGYRIEREYSFRALALSKEGDKLLEALEVKTETGYMCRLAEEISKHEHVSSEVYWKMGKGIDGLVGLGRENCENWKNRVE